MILFFIFGVLFFAVFSFMGVLNNKIDSLAKISGFLWDEKENKYERPHNIGRGKICQ